MFSQYAIVLKQNSFIFPSHKCPSSILIIVSLSWCCGGCGHVGGCGCSCGCLLPFLVCLGDMAFAEPCWYLFSDFAFHISTYGSAVKDVLYCQHYCNCKRLHVQIHEKTKLFLPHEIKCGLHSESMESPQSPQRLHGVHGCDSSQTPHEVHMDYMRFSWTSVATAIADVFRKNEISVGRKFAKILKIFDKIDGIKSRRVI